MAKRSKKPTNPLLVQSREALAALIVQAQSQEKLGEKLGVSQAAVSKWYKRGYMPMSRAIEVEALYGIPRQKTMDPRVVQALATFDSMLPTA